jgi:hypothetical protein
MSREPLALVWVVLLALVGAGYPGARRRSSLRPLTRAYNRKQVSSTYAHGVRKGAICEHRTPHPVHT